MRFGLFVTRQVEPESRMKESFNGYSLLSLSRAALKAASTSEIRRPSSHCSFSGDVVGVCDGFS
jgi:hypothetical protein